MLFSCCCDYACLLVVVICLFYVYGWPVMFCLIVGLVCIIVLIVFIVSFGIGYCLFLYCKLFVTCVYLFGY